MPLISDTLTVSLEQRLSQALAALNSDAILAFVDLTVKMRTQKGEFLPGSSPDAGTYRSTGHIRAREKKGLGVSFVDLSFTGAMLDATASRASTFEEQVRMEYGYLDGLSEDEATQLAIYHNDLGAGTSNVLRKFVGLTDAEELSLVDLIRQDLFANLTTQQL